MSRNSRYDRDGWGGWVYSKGRSKRRNALSIIRRENAQSSRRSHRTPSDKFGLKR